MENFSVLFRISLNVEVILAMTLIFSLVNRTFSQQDSSDQSTDKPVLKDPVDNKGVVIVAACIALFIVLALVALVIVRLCMKRRRSVQATEGDGLQKITTESGHSQHLKFKNEAAETKHPLMGDTSEAGDQLHTSHHTTTLSDEK